MLQKFGSLALCIDSTHKTNAYDFFLTTLLVVDNFGEGLPVAWMISNREDKDNILLFFLVLKNVQEAFVHNGLCLMILNNILLHGVTFLELNQENSLCVAY